MVLNHRFKRYAQRLGIKISKMYINPDRSHAENNEYERETFGICHQLISNPETTLLMSPISGKRYIKSDDSQIFIIIQSETINIVNHTYSYDIKVGSTNLYDRIVRIFDAEVETRREKMEADISANVKHSLKQIYKSVSDVK